ncbi:MAG: helix-turn-helix transcriptional regulator [Christensenella sp.]
MEFSQIFDELLIKKTISNYKMAQDTGLSDSLIGYWRKGKRKPTLDNIIAISNYLEVSIGYLLTGKDEKSPQTDLTESEREILKLVQPLSDKDKIKVIGIIENYLTNR